MEKFSALLSVTYYFTDDRLELPDFVLNQILNGISINWDQEAFVACCWMQNKFTKGEIFVLITDQRLVYTYISHGDKISAAEIKFTDITGLKRTFFKNITVLTVDGSNELFPYRSMPLVKLMNKMFDIIHDRYLIAKGII